MSLLRRVHESGDVITKTGCMGYLLSKNILLSVKKMFVWVVSNFYFFLLSGFSFTNMHESQNCRWRCVHCTSWKFSTCWKFSLYFVYIFIVDWNFLTKFCSSDPSFSRNILTYQYLKSEIFAHAQLCDYSFIHTIYKFHSMVSAGNSHWGYLLINGLYW